MKYEKIVQLLRAKHPDGSNEQSKLVARAVNTRRKEAIVHAKLFATRNRLERLEKEYTACVCESNDAMIALTNSNAEQSANAGTVDYTG